MGRAVRRGERAPAVVGERRAVVRDQPRQRGDEEPRLELDGDLPCVGRLGRPLRPRRAARRRQERLRAARARHRDQPVRQDGLHRSSDAELRRVREVHRGRLPRAAGASTPRPTADPTRDPMCARTRGSSATSTADFDFTQAPRPPMLLPVHPVTTLTPTVPFSPFTPSAVAGQRPGDADAGRSRPATAARTSRGYVVTPFVNGVAQTPRSFHTTATTQIVTGLMNGDDATRSRSRARNAVGVGYPSLPTGAEDHRCADRAADAVDRARRRRGAALVARPPTNNGSRVTGYVVTPFIGSVAQTSAVVPLRGDEPRRSPASRTARPTHSRSPPRTPTGPARDPTRRTRSWSGTPPRPPT